MRGHEGGVRGVPGGCFLLRTNEGLSFDDEELESKLVWIFGSPRTGSTWLMEMLCHPLKGDPSSQIGFAWRDGFEGAAAALPVDEFGIGAHLVVARGATQLDNGAVVPASLNFFYGSFSSYAFSRAYEDVWRPEARRFTLVRLHAVVSRAREAGLKLTEPLPLLVIKEVNSSHAADLVLSLFPRARMIFLVRDGRDVLDSLVDANGAGGWTMSGDEGAFETAAERREFVRAAALDWAASTNVCLRAYEDHDPALRRQVRYEDLRADTERCLTELLQWLELPSGPRRVRSVARGHSFEAVPAERRGPGRIRRSATPGRWREGLSREEQGMAQEIMGERLAALGYER